MLQLKKGYKKMKVKYLDLKNKRVFISGGGSGIGASIVEHFCEQNSEVYFIDIDVKASNKLIKSIKKKKLKAPNFIECNILDVKKLQKIIKDIITKKGPIHCLVNSAANDDRHSTDQVDEKYWDNRMNINLKHYFFAAQSVVKGMKKIKSGSIVNLSSVSWMLGEGDKVVYETAKSAVVGLTRSFAQEFGKYNIRTNSVIPGSIATERQIKHWLTPKYKKLILDSQALKRQLKPEDVSKLVLFLSSDQSSGCTKQSFVVDAGIA
jgi:NAD(P)-dependent dehydrogenase (short-subunit alcohol dehydrogenase family)|tara:strand:+ start:1098 stop:1889 length:792 start_codon:yes stop_codon:yes gene_type:complete